MLALAFAAAVLHALPWGAVGATRALHALFHALFVHVTAVGVVAGKRSSACFITVSCFVEFVNLKVSCFLHVDREKIFIILVSLLGIKVQVALRMKLRHQIDLGLMLEVLFVLVISILALLVAACLLTCLAAQFFFLYGFFAPHPCAFGRPALLKAEPCFAFAYHNFH